MPGGKAGNGHTKLCLFVGITALHSICYLAGWGVTGLGWGWLLIKHTLINQKINQGAYNRVVWGWLAGWPGVPGWGLAWLGPGQVGQAWLSHKMANKRHTGAGRSSARLGVGLAGKVKGRAGKGSAWQGWVQGQVGQARAWQGWVQGKVGQARAWQSWVQGQVGKASQGWVQGQVGQARAWQGWVQGQVGKARQAEAWLGRAGSRGRGLAWQGLLGELASLTFQYPRISVPFGCTTSAK
ncbi:hypothetical protein PPACK8108_LOCUS2763 [Phakopsora pachyrhizi]|uniref:Uncharacterized protein n=1 Tax=Phakopsora pachyrhizi TaxID=170000 RepID=A0AAV0ALL6_PHAPC|nr:hypothetical protein PPACK8108_LOCUS2763 [Phakopsora pachyrhizi]